MTDIRSTSRGIKRSGTLSDWEPVSGFEPLACRLRRGMVVLTWPDDVAQVPVIWDDPTYVPCTPDQAQPGSSA